MQNEETTAFSNILADYVKTVLDPFTYVSRDEFTQEQIKDITSACDEAYQELSGPVIDQFAVIFKGTTGSFRFSPPKHIALALWRLGLLCDCAGKTERVDQTTRKCTKCGALVEVRK